MFKKKCLKRESKRRNPVREEMTERSVKKKRSVEE